MEESIHTARTADIQSKRIVGRQATLEDYFRYIHVLAPKAEPNVQLPSLLVPIHLTGHALSFSGQHVSIKAIEITEGEI
jgi:hypothetical protein